MLYLNFKLYVHDSHCKNRDTEKVTNATQLILLNINEINKHSNNFNTLHIKQEEEIIHSSVGIT